MAKAKTAKKAQENGNVPLAAIPHLYHAEMLAWQKANFEALKAVYEELVKLNKRKK